MIFSVVPANSEILKQKAFEIRKAVFVVEQKVSHEDEFDEFEDISFHFVALNQNNEPVGASRWRQTEKGIKMERFAVKMTERGKGIGSRLVEATLKDIASKTEKGTYLYMHAQLDAIALYEKFGFQKKGTQFEECNIQHYLMWKSL